MQVRATLIRVLLDLKGATALFGFRFSISLIPLL